MPRMTATKRKAAPKPPRPRKKQAVTKTNSATVKDLIRKNQANSPLLGLPSEIREKILTNVVGDNLIHIRYFTDVNLDLDLVHHEYDEMNSVQKRAGLWHVICAETRSEQNAYNDTFLKDRVVSRTIPQEGNTDSYHERHMSCALKPYNLGDYHNPSETRQVGLKLDLRVLGTSRQLYEEANHLLWATNTFSFDRSLSLSKFMDELNPAQKRHISSLHINADLDNWRYEEQSWFSAFKPSYINMLKGARNLHLCFAKEFDQFLSLANFPLDTQNVKDSVEENLRPFLRLRALNLTNVTIILDEPVHSYLRGLRNKETDRKQIMDICNACTRNLRTQLLDSRGADVEKTNAEATKVINRATLQTKAKDRLVEAQRSITLAHSFIRKAELKANRLESKADRLEMEAEELGDESFDKIRRNLEVEVEELREYAEWKASTMKYLEKHADERKAIYERATARVEGRQGQSSLRPNEAKYEQVDAHKHGESNEITNAEPDWSRYTKWGYGRLERELKKETEDKSPAASPDQESP